MDETSPLHTQLTTEMARRIRSGEWPQGERVPSEKALVAEFGTSRGPVRQALAALRSEGMIVGGRGSPPRVHRIAPAQSFDVFMSFTEWARSLGLEPGHRIIEAGLRPATEDTARELGITPDSPIVEIIRLRLLDDKPAMLERSSFPVEVGRRLLESGLGSGLGVSPGSLSSANLSAGSIHRALHAVGVVPVRARHLIDAITAHPLEIEQLQLSPGAPLLRVRRRSFDAHGTVIETADDRYLPDMTSFVIENAPMQRIPLAPYRAYA